ncbi:uncharacterized protein LOC126804144 [Argentina anserina]|uniref:uncharacterized protein LOC126804144 n=1 Tax=Argentina anserina TaxID=57926 RepID=UPI0021768D09|nr:uncharacterized protein LOC126804144 [Potentilla anserina]
MANFNKKQLREPPSVPFIWEERPGIAKKDWKPTVSSNGAAPTPPVKLIASVPFIWEEKPGTPLPYFVESPSASATPEPMMLITYPSPPIWSQQNDHGGGDYSDGSNGDDNGEYEIQSVFKLDMEAFDFETEDSFSSAPSLLANCLVSSLAISTAVPAPEDTDHTATATPSSPLSEEGSSTSSYATGSSSLVGGAFLECLFPLLPSKAGFLEKVGQSDDRTLTPQGSNTKYFDRERNGSITLRPRTLGELILMSRKSSYRRKAVQMRKQNLPKELMMKNAFGCCIFGTGKTIEGLHSKRKNLLRLLM